MLWNKVSLKSSKYFLFINTCIWGGLFHVLLQTLNKHSPTQVAVGLKLLQLPEHLGMERLRNIHISLGCRGTSQKSGSVWDLNRSSLFQTEDKARGAQAQCRKNEIFGDKSWLSAAAVHRDNPAWIIRVRIPGWSFSLSHGREFRIPHHLFDAFRLEKNALCHKNHSFPFPFRDQHHSKTGFTTETRKFWICVKENSQELLSGEGDSRN